MWGKVWHVSAESVDAEPYFLDTSGRTQAEWSEMAARFTGAVGAEGAVPVIRFGSQEPELAQPDSYCPVTDWQPGDPLYPDEPAASWCQCGTSVSPAHAKPWQCPECGVWNSGWE